MNSGKKPLWLSGIMVSALLMFYSLFFASEKIAFGHLKYFQVVAYVSIALFVICTAAGVLAAVSRRKAKASGSNES